MDSPLPRGLALAFVVSVPVGGVALAQGVERISVATSGESANTDVLSLTRPSDSGRFVAFTTTATNLVAGDVPGTQDVFLRDRVLGTTTRIVSDGVAADLTSSGEHLAYLGLNPVVANLLDLATHTNTALTTAPEPSLPGTFSANGRYLLFMRPAPIGVGPLQVWRREIQTGADDLVSATFAGTTNTVDAWAGHLSADGSIATFTTADPNIVPGDGNGKEDAFYKDYGFGFTDRVSVDHAGAEIPGDSSAGAISLDTRYFLFSTESPAEPNDTNGAWDLYVADRYLGELRRASVSSSGVEGNASTQSIAAWNSFDGTRVIFDSLASNLVGGDTNGVRDVFEHDFATGITRRLVVGLGGSDADAAVTLRGVSADGRYLTVLSAATNLVAGPAPSGEQAYLVDLGPQCLIVNYCTALPNSTGRSATIQVTGSPSFSLNNLVFSALDLPDDATCMFFHGTARVDPAVVFGDGLRCAGGVVTRLGTLASNDGAVIQFQDLGGAPYAGVQPGDIRRFQLVYRDVPAGGAGFNTTAAIELTFCP